MQMSSKQFYPFIGFSVRLNTKTKFTAHNCILIHGYAGNADLNLILVARVTNGCIFQMIDSLMQSMRVHLTLPNSNMYTRCNCDLQFVLFFFPTANSSLSIRFLSSAILILPFSRVITKISSCWVNTTSRGRGGGWGGNQTARYFFWFYFGSIF